MSFLILPSAAVSRELVSPLHESLESALVPVVKHLVRAIANLIDSIPDIFKHLSNSIFHLVYRLAISMIRLVNYLILYLAIVAGGI